MLAKNVGPAKKSVAPYPWARATRPSGRDGAGSRIAAAPTESGKNTEFPNPYAKNAFAADNVRSSGVMPNTWLPYVSHTTRTEPWRCIAAFGDPVVPDVY